MNVNGSLQASSNWTNYGLSDLQLAFAALVCPCAPQVLVRALSWTRSFAGSRPSPAALCPL